MKRIAPAAALTLFLVGCSAEPTPPAAAPAPAADASAAPAPPPGGKAAKTAVTSNNKVID